MQLVCSRQYLLKYKTFQVKCFDSYKQLDSYKWSNPAALELSIKAARRQGNYQHYVKSTIYI